MGEGSHFVWMRNEVILVSPSGHVPPYVVNRPDSLRNRAGIGSAAQAQSFDQRTVAFDVHIGEVAEEATTTTNQQQQTTT